MTATSGNVDSVTYSLNGDAVRQTEIDRVRGYVQGAYGRRTGNGATARTANQIRGGGGYDRELNDRVFGFSAVDLERNLLADLELRSTLSGGLGYHLVRREGLTFDVSSGPAYNREQYRTETRSNFEWLVAEESTQSITPTLSFRQRLAFFANLRDTGEYRLAFDAGFVLKVTDSWAATLTLNDRYQSNPPPGVKRNDLLVVGGLQYTFGPKVTPPPVLDVRIRGPLEEGASGQAFCCSGASAELFAASPVTASSR